jgi:hypothetical protein
MNFRRLLAVASLFLAGAAHGVTTQDLNTLTVDDLAAILAGPGITITNVKFTGAPIAAGRFDGGLADGLGVESGVILSTGDIAEAAGPNDTESETTSLGTGGDADLDTIVAPLNTQDAAILEFDFVTSGPTFAIRYVFASEEYVEYVDSAYNDVFGYFVDGSNIALVPGSADVVSINSINHKRNTQFYRNNPAGLDAFATQFDGFTVELIAQAVVTPGETHHIKIAIADTSDTLLDAAVFLAQGGITGVALPNIIVDPPQIVLGNGDSAEFDITVSNIDEDDALRFSIEGMDQDTEAVFTPGELHVVEGIGKAKMRLTIGDHTLPRRYVLLVHGTTEDVKATATVDVEVACTPPFLYGLPANQPGNASVVSGGRTELRVVPSGSPPFSYQWYRGPSGSTFFPIAGGTSDHVTTPEIHTPTTFWVRVTNPCGTVDSWTATVTPTTQRSRGR